MTIQAQGKNNPQNDPKYDLDTVGQEIRETLKYAGGEASKLADKIESDDNLDYTDLDIEFLEYAQNFQTSSGGIFSSKLNRKEKKTIRNKANNFLDDEDPENTVLDGLATLEVNDDYDSRFSGISKNTRDYEIDFDEYDDIKSAGQYFNIDNSNQDRESSLGQSGGGDSFTDLFDDEEIERVEEQISSMIRNTYHKGRRFLEEVEDEEDDLLDKVPASMLRTTVNYHNSSSWFGPKLNQTDREEVRNFIENSEDYDNSARKALKEIKRKDEIDQRFSEGLPMKQNKTIKEIVSNLEEQ